MKQCECQRWMGDKAEACLSCGQPNPTTEAPKKIRRAISDVLWCLLFVATIFYFVMYMILLGRAENAIQQVFAAADTMAWTVLSYVFVRSITSALRK